MLPHLVLVVLFLLWPLASMTSASVSDPALRRALPRTAAASAGRDRRSDPPAAMRAALVEDLRRIDEGQVPGDVVRRLNGAPAGFRTLVGETTAAAKDDDGAIDLDALDRRWDDVAYWRALAEAAAPSYTDRNLPADESADRAIMLRTFAMSATVTLACVPLGLPYAMLAASQTGWRRQVLLAAVLLPLWTSLLVRAAAWFILLQANGPINAALVALRLTDAPVQMIFNRTGVIIAVPRLDFAREP